MSEKNYQASRRRFLGLSLGLGIGATSVLARTAHTVTPAQTEGPFYPIRPQNDKDVDLTQIKGRKQKAQGRIIKVRGLILDEQGKPIENALVEIWQANSHGRYSHERDPNPAPLDANFQGWGQHKTKQSGGFAFTTIFPGAYPAAEDWMRPPHIHFKIARRGYHELTTQMYFPAQVLNNKDLILKKLTAEEQKKLIAIEKVKGQYIFNIVLRKV